MRVLHVPHHVPLAHPAIRTNTVTSWIAALKFGRMVFLDMHLEKFLDLKAIHQDSVTAYDLTNIS